MYRSDTVNKKESAGSAAAVGSIDCGSREACSIEDRRRLPRRVPPFFPNRLMTSIPSRNAKTGIDQLLENI